VRTEWLEKVAKTESDRACPHGGQFYDVVIEGERHVRAAWVYEVTRPAPCAVAGRFGVWGDEVLGMIILGKLPEQETREELAGFH